MYGSNTTVNVSKEDSPSKLTSNSQVGEASAKTQQFKPPSGGQKRPTSFHRNVANGNGSRGNSPSPGAIPGTISYSNGNGNGHTNGSLTNQDAKPFPMLFASASKKPRLSSPSSQDDRSNGSDGGKPERLVSLSDRFSYRGPATASTGSGGSISSPTGSSSSLLDRYSALLDGGKKSSTNGHTNGTANNGFVNRGPTPMTVDESLVNQLHSMYTSPIETIRLAVKVYKTFDRASEWLSHLEANKKSGQGSVYVKPQSGAPAVAATTTKREVSKPTLSIRDRFSSSRQQQKLKENNTETFRDFIDDDESIESPPKTAAPKRKLVKIYDQEYPFSDDSENEEDYLSPSEIEFEARLLDFLNTAALEDIVDVSSCPEEQVKILIEARPLSSLAEAKTVNAEEVKDGKTKRRGGQKKSVGEKIVDASYSVS